MKKTAGDMIILHKCTKNPIIWGMVPEICCETDRIFFCHFGPIFALLSPNHPRKSKFWQNEEAPRDVIILHMCIIHDSHIMHGSWDMKCNRHNFLSFWATFFNFTPIAAQKIKIKKKNAWRYHHFTQVYQKSWSYYAILFLRFGTWQM